MRKNGSKAVWLLAIALLVIFGLSQERASAADFPTKTIMMIIPYGAGGGSDIAARTISALAERELGTSINSVNISGGGGATGLLQLYDKKPDGYTLGTCTSSLSALKPQGRMRYSTADYEPVIGFQANTYAIGVNKKSPFKTIKEFIEYAKKNPKKLNMGTSSIGGNLYLGAFAFQNEAGIKLNFIPDAGGASKNILEVAGGNLDSAVGGPNEFQAQIEAGNVRLLAVMSQKRCEAYPDVPTLIESGINLEFMTARFILAPPNTPEARIKILHDAFKKAWDSDKWQQYLKTSGSEKFYYGYKEAKEYVKKQDAMYVKLLTEAGLAKK